MEMSICTANQLQTLEGEEDANSRPWSDLLLEFVDLIASKLSLADRIRFPSVCKSWGSTSTSISDAKRWPWLMYLTNELKGLYNMFDPLDGKVYKMDEEVPTDVCLALRSSKDGWALLTDGNYSIFMMNPFTSEPLFELPMLPYAYLFYGVSFSSPPTNSDCMVMGISDTTNFRRSDVEICTWRYGEDTWSENVYHNNIPFLVAENNPVFHEGCFYCLSRCGNIGVFDPKNNSWTVLDKPKTADPMNARESHYEIDMVRHVMRKCKEQCYLVENSKGELLSVFDYNNGKPISVSRLDKSNMSWEKVEDLGDEIIFVDSRSSISIAAPFEGTGNRIYFPRCFCDDGCPQEGVYYDLKSKKYHSNPKYDIEERASCVWILPRMHDSS